MACDGRAEGLDPQPVVAAHPINFPLWHPARSLDNVAIPSIAGDPSLGQEDHGRAAARGSHRNERQGWRGETGTVSPPRGSNVGAENAERGQGGGKALYRFIHGATVIAGCDTGTDHEPPHVETTAREEEGEEEESKGGGGQGGRGAPTKTLETMAYGDANNTHATPSRITQRHT